MDTKLSGLVNCGNTCYINTVLQLLLHTYELNDIIKGTNNITKEWIDLRELLVSKQCTISPKRFLYFIFLISKKENYIFKEYSQEDITEFLMFLIEQFHNSIIDEKIICNSPIKEIQNIYKDYSKIKKTFFSIQEIDIIDNDKSIKKIYDSNFILNLSIPNKENINMYDCLDHYTNDELLEGENSYYDENDKTHKEVIKKLIFKELPKIMVIALKRWNNGKKIKNIINVQTELTMDKYSFGNNHVYELYGIGNHSGIQQGGHYTSFIKHNNIWVLMNDSQISTIPECKIASPNNYLFFYRRNN